MQVWHAEMSEEVVTSSGKVAHYRWDAIWILPCEWKTSMWSFMEVTVVQVPFL